MIQGGFYERKRMSPGAIGVVVLLHGAAITALVMAKEGITPHIPTRTAIDFLVDPPPPPPKPPEPKPRVEPKQQEQITTVRTFELPTRETWDVPPLPPLPPQPHVQPSQETVIAPPPPPPPPPQPKMEPKIEPARAKANLGSYVSDADYPADAIRREEQGATRFKLAVGPDGRVIGCTVTGSSGSAALDLATCRLMKSRARFAPARDSSGSPTSDTVTSTIVWRLPVG